MALWRQEYFQDAANRPCQKAMCPCYGTDTIPTFELQKHRAFRYRGQGKLPIVFE